MTLIPAADTLGAPIEIQVHLKVKAAHEQDHPTPPVADDSGCNCGVAGRPADRDVAWVGVLLFGLAARRRRAGSRRGETTLS